ncbi:MAG: transposase, partial [Azonexus sp.]|nr:transposase [Azonexus sp.]
MYRVLDHLALRGIGCRKAQADHENDQQVQSDECGDDPPGDAEFQLLELEECQPAQNHIAEKENKSCEHCAGPSGTRGGGRRCLARVASQAGVFGISATFQAVNFLIDGPCFLARETPDVDNIGWFEGPDERLNPWVNRRQESCPTQQIHCFGVRMLTGNGNSARQASEPDPAGDNGNAGQEQRGERQVRVLMTSLLDTARYPATSFSALYHSRWRIEEAFKRIKHRLN